jgi:hypothetical protein
VRGGRSRFDRSNLGGNSGIEKPHAPASYRAAGGGCTLLRVVGAKSPYHSLTLKKANEQRRLVITHDFANGGVSDSFYGTLVYSMPVSLSGSPTMSYSRYGA